MVGDATDASRRVGHALGDALPVEEAGVDHRLLHDRQRGLQAEHAEGGRCPLAVLVLVGVRGVVGGDDVDRPVGQPGAQRGAVCGGAQRRVDLEDRVVGLGELVSEQQVVRAGLRGDVDALALGVAHDLDRPGRGDVAHVQARAHVGGKQAVAGDDRLLGDGRPPGQPEAAGELALVHLGALGQARLLGVLGDDAVERLDVLQRASHQDRVADALAVVGEDPHPGGGVCHRAQLGELLALEADGDGADGVDVAVAGLPAQPPDLLDDARGVGDRLGVGHRVDGGEAAHRGGLGAGLDGLGVLATGLAQVGVQVDEAGEGHETGAVDDLGLGGVEVGADRLHEAAVEQQVGRAAAEDGDGSDQVRAHASFSLSAASALWSEPLAPLRRR